jgi:hypothetical protein
MSSDAAGGPRDIPAAPAPRPPWVGTLARLALGAAVGLAIGKLGVQFGKSLAHGGATVPVFDGWEKGALAAVLLLVFLIVLFCHEFGHLMAGRLVGFRSFLLIVGPVRFERSGDRWGVHLNKDLALAGGLAASAPMDTRDLRRRTAVMVAGGPVASALVALGAGLAPYMLGPIRTTSSFGDVLLFETVSTLALMSAAIALVTLLPYRTAGFLSDGARLLRLIRGGPVAARDSAIQAILGSTLSGLRPRDWDPELLRAACELRDGSMFELTALQFAQMHAADSGHTEESLIQLRQLLPHVERLPKMMRGGVHLDAARQFALAGHLEEARRHRALAAGPAIGAPHLQPLADAALLAAEGRDAEALALLPPIRPMLARSFDRGGAKWMTDSLDALYARLTATPRPAPASPPASGR